jgi:hypothetical protein
LTKIPLYAIFIVEVENMTIKVDEKFISVGIKTVDSKNRISLGEKILKVIDSKGKAEAYRVFIGKEGDILLRPVVTIPAREAWIYEDPEILKKIHKGLGEAGKSKAKKANDLDKFFKEL